jgi:hypothetical protein
LGWAQLVRAPDGTYPLFNDAALDAAPTLDRLSALGGALGIVPLETGVAEQSDGVTLTRVEPTGWLRLDAPGGACLMVDAAPDAAGWQPGHAHADGLTFELWVRSRRTIVDFGVASYALGHERTQTRATRSHNTLELDGRDSCEVWSAFRVGRRGSGRVLAAHLSEGRCQLELEHDGYRWRPGRPRHLRTIDFRNGSLEIHDRVVDGQGEPFVSRIRVDAKAADELHIEGAPETPGHAFGLWYPRHGDALSAEVHSLRGRAGNHHGVRWRIQW